MWFPLIVSRQTGKTKRERSGWSYVILRLLYDRFFSYFSFSFLCCLAICLPFAVHSLCRVSRARQLTSLLGYLSSERVVSPPLAWYCITTIDCLINYKNKFRNNDDKTHIGMRSLGPLRKRTQWRALPPDPIPIAIRKQPHHAYWWNAVLSVRVHFIVYCRPLRRQLFWHGHISQSS